MTRRGNDREMLIHRCPLLDTVDRRAFVRTTTLATMPIALGLGRLLADPPAKNNDEIALIPRQKDPLNLEFPFRSLGSFLTPNKLHFVRNHFAEPELTSRTWRLEVVGAVKQRLNLTLDDITKMAGRTQPVTLECAGNGRAYLDPKTKGVQWELGAVSTAEWTGVPLSAVLEQAGLRSGAVDVVLEGADAGEPSSEPKPIGKIHFARGLPLDKAMKPEVLLAHRMNNEVLPRSHGYPLRAIIAGWYGMASVKWLKRIVVTDRPFRGYDQTTDYAIWERRDGLATLTPITEMQVKTSIARPAPSEKLSAGKSYRIHGAAWAGESDVSKVEISTDGGGTWKAARFLDRAVPFCWRRWEYHWEEPAAGKHRLLARATDQYGRVQPSKRDADRRNYMIGHIVPLEVLVE